jgi:hypothetical protein
MHPHHTLVEAAIGGRLRKFHGCHVSSHIAELIDYGEISNGFKAARGQV